MYRPLLRIGSSLLVFLSISSSYSWEGKTHRYQGDTAKEFLPQNAKEFFTEFRNDLLRGAVNADRYARLHHVYFSTINGRNVVIDDSAAIFAQSKADQAINLIREARKHGTITAEEKGLFAELCGECVHCVADMHSVHTMPYEDPLLHRKIEHEINRKIHRVPGEGYSSDFDIKFDGVLRKITPYDAVIQTARDAHFGRGQILSAAQIERRINLNNSGYYEGYENWDREVQRSMERLLNVQVNRSAEVLNYIFERSFADPVEIFREPDRVVER